jgi:hypothetical protein
MGNHGRIFYAFLLVYGLFLLALCIGTFSCDSSSGGIAGQGDDVGDESPNRLDVDLSDGAIIEQIKTGHEKRISLVYEMSDTISGETEPETIDPPSAEAEQGTVNVVNSGDLRICMTIPGGR